MFPDIGHENDTVANLRETIDVQKKDLVEKEQKCAALQRNFESLSGLCLKAENDKNAAISAKKQL